jgi:Cu(I)/Ag(I) efflux system membrane fusion protein
MTTRMLVLATLALAGCGRSEEASPMAGMTAEEHARMMAGGTQGAFDSAGAAIRQPVRLTASQEQALGVTYVAVTRGLMIREIRTVGDIVTPETSIAEVTTRVEGFVEGLAVSSVGEQVRQGQPLLTLYSPALVAAQEDLLAAQRLRAVVDPSDPVAVRNAEALVEASRQRLALWNMPEETVVEVGTTGDSRRLVTLRAPVGGIVLEKMVLNGQRVMPGMTLYRIADLSTVWVEGDVFEQDLRFVRPGMEAHIEVSAYPGEHLMGRVSFVYPTMDPMVRTNHIRIELANPGLRLKPGMFATIYLDAPIGDAITVPMSAVIATGERNVVFVREEGMLVPRAVVTGARTGDRIEILDGLAVGETVVRSANFLVDAESRLGATGTGMPGMQHGPAAAPAAKPPAATEHNHD